MKSRFFSNTRDEAGSALAGLLLLLCISPGHAASSATKHSSAATPTEIFFATAKGKTYLPANPDKNYGDESRERWTLPDGRKVMLKMTYSPTRYDLALSAEPQDDITSWGLSLDATPDEYFTGINTRTIDGPQSASWATTTSKERARLNLRGESFDVLVKPTLGLYAPFFISSRHYGVFAHGTWPGHIDFCTNGDTAVKLWFSGPDLKLTFYFGTPAEIVQAHALETGPSFVPPKWTFRPWRWRDEIQARLTFYDGTRVKEPYNSQLVEDILMMQHYDIPCGAYWVDRPWGPGVDGYDDMLWDPVRFPHHQQMIDWVNAQHIKFMLWIAPFVMGHQAQVAIDREYILPAQPYVHGRELLDFTNPEAVKWWQPNIARLIQEGVAGFKLDRSEEDLPTDEHALVHDGRSWHEYHNQYPVDYIKAVSEVGQKLRPGDFLAFPRAGYTGSAKWGGFWGGDIGSPALGLRTAIIGAQRAAVMGYPVWGTDTGGYWSGPTDPEVTERWLGFSCFTPIFEFGPTENGAPWDMVHGPRYNTELIAAWRLYAKLHDSLADYSLALAQEAHKTGMPAVRPLFLQYPDQPKAWEQWSTFLYGRDILVSPIWEKGQTSKSVYFPAGEHWIDAWNPANVLNGGQTITVQAPLPRIPIYIRQGSKTSLGDLNALWQESVAKAEVKPDLAAMQKDIH